MWKDNFYFYNSKVLKCIAENYTSLYDDGLSFREGDRITDPSAISEFVCDFDQALSSLGKKWQGVVSLEFKNYRSYSRFQRIIIATILGLPDEELTRLRFSSIIRLRAIAFSRMRSFLNGE